MGSKTRTLLALPLVLIGLTGCSITRPVILHPIEKTDIFSIEEGSRVTSPSGEETITEKPGQFLSDYYLKEVMRARIGK